MLEQTPTGAIIVHQYYPGFIDLPAMRSYLVISDGLAGMVQVLSHVRPLVVTDFNNSLVRRSPQDGKVCTGIDRPINDINLDSVVVDGTGHEGRSAPMIAVEHDRTGRIFYQDIYTELQVIWEFSGHADSQNLSLYKVLLERFITTYRYLNPDTRLSIASEIPLDTTPLRVGQHLYSSDERALPFDKRVAGVWPKALSLSISSYGRAGRALQDHVGDEGILMKRGENVNAYLCNGFKLSENMIEIQRLADLAFNGLRRRAAIVEAMSILEVGLHEVRKRLATVPRGAQLFEGKSRQIPWKDLINKELPKLLTFFDGVPDPIIKIANEALRLRNLVVHNSYSPTPDEANVVLSTVSKLLWIFEGQETFKGNWKLQQVSE